MFGIVIGPALKAQEWAKPAPPKDYKGVVKLDVRDSKPDWGPWIPKKAPEGAPNVLFILYDDTGLAAWSPFGGRISMPTLDKLAANGITYSQWHTTALCSPTRSTLLTGRNHHLNGMAAITEGANGFPGANANIPDQCATIADVLRDNGYATFWLGKDHNVPEQDVAPEGDRKQWPCQQGFDRFYGFLGGETNQWYPDLVEDNRFIDPPATPEQGYHLSKDLADQAIMMIGDLKASNPSKPFYMWFCPGANHAPHQAPQDYIDKYKGKFDDGYDAYRKWVLPRMIERGVLPKGTELTSFNGYPDELSENMKYLDKLGGPDTYEHYPTGWAAAFSTPFQMFKRYSYAGGTADPLVISWPKGIKARGEVRDQYHHSTDIVPTILAHRQSLHGKPTPIIHTPQPFRKVWP